MYTNHDYLINMLSVKDGCSAVCESFQCQPEKGCLDDTPLAGGKYCWALLAILAFYTFIFSELAIGAQGANLHYTMNVSNNTNCTDAFSDVRTYFLIEAIILIFHSGIWLLYIITMSMWSFGLCCCRAQNTGDKNTVMVDVGLYRLDVIMSAFYSMFWIPRMNLFVKLWDIMILGLLGFTGWGVYLAYKYSDKRFCEPGAWDAFYLHCQFILYYILAMFVFIIFLVSCVFNERKQESTQNQYINTKPIPKSELMRLMNTDTDQNKFSYNVAVVDGEKITYELFLISVTLRDYIAENFKSDEEDMFRAGEEQEGLVKQ